LNYSSFGSDLKVYETVLPVVLWGCEMWYLILSEEHQIQVFRNRIQTKTFSPQKDESSLQYNVAGRPSFI
jgi:hypothetical protein